MIYRHTQSSFGPWLVAFAAGVALAAVFAASGKLGGSNLVVLLVLALFVAGGFVFARLTVIVDPVSVVVTFGVGWPRRQFPIGDIVTARAVRNRWWHGWGIRWIPGGTMYNVRGLDAVELQLRSGKRFRIGTDETEKLLAALLTVRPSGPPR